VTWTTVSQYVAIVSGVTAILSLLIGILGRTNQPKWSAQRVIGWLVVVLGLLAVGASAYWVAHLHLGVKDPSARFPLGAIAGAALITALGVVRVWRAQPTREVESLQVVARAVLDSLDEPEGRDLVVVGGPSHTSWRLWRSVHRRRAAGIDRAPRGITALLGAAGSGRTSALRWAAAVVAQDVLRQRNPKRMAVYLDLARLPPDAEVDADRIRSLLVEVLSRGDEFIARHVADNLPTAGSRVLWTFLLDSAQEPPDRRRAVERLLAAGGRAGAVLAMDDRPGAAPPGLPALVLDPLGRRQQKRIARIADVQAVVLSDLRRTGKLDPVLQNPRLLTMVLRALRTRAGTAPLDLAGALDLIVDGALMEAGVQDDAIEDERIRAAALAYGLMTDSGSGGSGLADVLTRASLLRPDGRGFVHPLLQEHLAVDAVLLGAVALNTATLLGDPRLQGVAIAVAAQTGSPAQRALVDAAIEKLETATARTTLIDPAAALAVTSLRALPHHPIFAFPAYSVRALEVLAAAGRSGLALPAHARSLVDRFVATAVVAGTPYERQQAVAVLAAASDEVAAWTAELALATGQSWVQRAATAQAAQLSEVFVRLSVRARVNALWQVLRPPEDEPRPVSLTRPPRTGPGLAPMLGRLRVVACIGTAVSVVLLAPNLVDTVVTNPDGRGGAIFGLGLIFVVLAFSLGVGRLAEGHWQKTIIGGLLATALLGGLYLLFSALLIVSAVISLLSGEFLSAAGDLLVAYALSWFAAAGAAMVLVVEPTWAQWVLPHVVVARDLWESEVRDGGGIWSIGRRDPNSRRTPIQELRARLDDGTLSGADVLEWFSACDKEEECLRLLRRLRQAPPEALRRAGPALTDLTRAVEHVSRFVPETETTIPPAVWEVGPDYSTPAFVGWLVEFDRLHPGRLSWLASSRRDELGKILTRAYAARSDADGARRTGEGVGHPGASVG
jgi:hypothetical protein